jgi:hypothetical protein
VFVWSTKPSLSPVSSTFKRHSMIVIPDRRYRFYGKVNLTIGRQFCSRNFSWDLTRLLLGICVFCEKAFATMKPIKIKVRFNVNLTACQQDVFALLVPSCWQVWNKLLSSCWRDQQDKVDEANRLATSFSDVVQNSLLS